MTFIIPKNLKTRPLAIDTKDYDIFLLMLGVSLPLIIFHMTNRRKEKRNSDAQKLRLL